MEIVSTFNQESKFVTIQAIGQFPNDNQSIDNYFEYVAKECQKHGTKKLLLDYREMEYAQTVSQIVRGPERAIQYGFINTGFIVAGLFKFNSPTYQNYQLFLTEMKTRKLLQKIEIEFRVFDDYDKSLDWLGKY